VHNTCPHIASALSDDNLLPVLGLSHLSEATAAAVLSQSDVKLEIEHFLHDSKGSISPVLTKLCIGIFQNKHYFLKK